MALATQMDCLSGSSCSMTRHVSEHAKLASLAGCPAEILEHILQDVECNCSHMLQLAMVCRRWNPIATELAHARCEVHGRRNLLTLFFLHGRKNSISKLELRESLTIRGTGDCSLDLLRVEDSHFVTPLCTRLHTLNLVLIPDWRYSANQNVKRLPHIRSFSLEVARRPTSTYTNTTRMIAYWLCVVGGATSVSITGAQWLDHVAVDYPWPTYDLKSLSMRQCTGERSDLFLRLMSQSTLQSLTIDDTAVPALLSSFSPNLTKLTFEDHGRMMTGKLTPARTLELLISQWKHLRDVTLPASCSDLHLRSDSIVRLELRGPPLSPLMSIDRCCEFTGGLGALRHLILPPMLPTLDLLFPSTAGIGHPNCVIATHHHHYQQNIKDFLSKREVTPSMLSLRRQLVRRGIKVEYSFAHVI